MMRKRKGTDLLRTRRYYAHDVFRRNTGWPIRLGHIHHSNGCPHWVEWIAEGKYDFHNLELFVSNSSHILRHREECRTKVFSQKRDERGILTKESDLLFLELIE